MRELRKSDDRCDRFFGGFLKYYLCIKPSGIPLAFFLSCESYRKREKICHICHHQASCALLSAPTPACLPAPGGHAVFFNGLCQAAEDEEVTEKGVEMMEINSGFSKILFMYVNPQVYPWPF